MTLPGSEGLASLMISILIMPVGELIKKINQKLRGHYQYYGVTDNTRGVKSFKM